MKSLNFSTRLINTFETVFLPKQDKPTAKLSSWRRLWQQFINSLMSQLEPQVWQKTDRFGHTYWQAYDPISDRTFTSDTEADMRRWIEQRYYA